MKTSYIRYKQSDIAFATAGNGEKILCCFHGFGETGRSFTHLTHEVGKIYTIIAVDLPFHGETRWNEGLLMQPADLTNILDLIFAALYIMPEKKQRYSLLGYSLGGRLMDARYALPLQQLDRACYTADSPWNGAALAQAFSHPPKPSVDIMSKPLIPDLYD